ncbi:MAG: hypothetical protein RLN75_08135 [Longimicrobiales bacterium]
MNVLVALAWPNHVHHTRAIRWFEAIRPDGWATCAATEAGFVRVSSNTRIIPDARPPAEVLALLRAMVQMPGHRFWDDDVSPAEDSAGFFARVVGYRQVTDARLVTLAHRRSGRLATFDRGIVELAGPRAAEVVEMIP